jgi:hypothetical protein
MRSARAAAPAPVSAPTPAPVEQPGPPVDPYAAIRSLQFNYVPEQVYESPYSDSEAGGGAGSWTNPAHWTTDFQALKPHGFQSKYNSVGDVTDKFSQYADQLGGKRVIQLTTQDPGKHKYDTLESYYLVDPATGQGQLLGTPGQSRQISSVEKARDAYEEAGKAIGPMILSAGVLGPASGALANSINAATGIGAAASGVAANALIQGGLAELQGGDFARGALTGGLTSLATPYLSDLSQAANETFGNIGGAAVSNAASSALRTALGGGNTDEILAELGAGALSGGVNAGASSFLDEFDIPAPAQRLLTGALTDAALGRDLQQGLLNRGIGEIFRPEDPNAAALRAAYGEEGQRERMAEGNFQAQQQAPYGDYLDPFSGFGPASGVPEWDTAAAVAGVPGIGNLETDFFVTDRGPIIDSAGNQGQFVDGNWVVESTPPGYAPTAPPAPAPAPRGSAPAPAPRAPAPAPVAQRGRSSDDLLALAALMGGQQQPNAPVPYELANTAPGVQTGMSVIEQMFGRG